MKGGDLLMNLEEYYDDIYRYCFFRMQDHSLAEDEEKSFQTKSAPDQDFAQSLYSSGT